MYIHIVYGPSKSSTTSIFEMLSDNQLYPAIQTHGEFMSIGIRDNLQKSPFTEYIISKFADFIKPTDQFGAHPTAYSIALYFGQNYQAQSEFIEFLRTHALKFITPFRDPIERAISAFCHWLDNNEINSLYMLHRQKQFDPTQLSQEDIAQLNHEPIQKILTALLQQNLTIHTLKNIFKETFEKDLLREYLCVLYNLRMRFGFNITNPAIDIQEIQQNSWHLLNFKLERLRDVLPVLYAYLDVPKTYQFPHCRNKLTKDYIIPKEQVSQLIKECRQVPLISCFPTF